MFSLGYTIVMYIVDVLFIIMFLNELLNLNFNMV